MSKPQNSLASVTRRPPEERDFASAILGTTLQNQITKSVPDERARSRFTSMIIQTVNQSAELQKCTPASIVSAALRGEGMGLQTGLHFYVIPYGGTAAFILGYKGMIALAMNTNMYESLDVVDVREGEYLGRNPRNGQPMFNMNLYGTDDEEREKHSIVGYLGFFELVNGYKRSEYWTIGKIVEHAVKYSHIERAKILKIMSGEVTQEASKRESPWYDYPDGFGKMCYKTVMRSLLSSGYAPITNELRYILDTDSDYVIPDGPKTSAPDPLRDIIDSSATVSDVPAPDASPSESEQRDTADLQPEGKETHAEAPKAASRSRKASQKANQSDPLRGNMNPPEEMDFFEAEGQQSLFDQM